jgi:hypothetical protein
LTVDVKHFRGEHGVLVDQDMEGALSVGELALHPARETFVDKPYDTDLKIL